MNTIEFGAFISESSAYALRQDAQRVARDLGVTISADGSRFAGSGALGDPYKVVVTLPRGTEITESQVTEGRDRLDALLSGNDRLTDYALVKEDGRLVAVVSTLTGEIADLDRSPLPEPEPEPQVVAEATPTRPRRWSPFRRN